MRLFWHFSSEFRDFRASFGVQELEPSPYGPFLMVVCPSIGRPGGTGVRSLGWQWCCGSAIVCPSSAPLHFSMLRSLYFLTVPLLWRSSPWPSLPWVQWGLLLSLLQGFFYSRLFAMWLSSGSWRPVMTLSHLLCFCDSVSISDGAHSVCAPVSMSGDWMAYLVLRAAFSSGAGPSCFSSPSALPLLRHCLSIQGSLLCPPMAPLVFTWVLAPVSAFLPTLLLRVRR